MPVGCPHRSCGRGSLSDRVLIIGGYGVFGGILAQRLARDPDVDVHVAGRRQQRAAAFCARWGGTPHGVDREATASLQRLLVTLKPKVVVDAAGPFQVYGADPMRIARLTIGAGAHYLDLADDRGFVTGIAALDDMAKRHDVAAISGASSVPALSAAAADALACGLRSVAMVDSVILPGNRAPRGLSVVRAILSQVGRPMRVLRGGRWRAIPGWTELVSQRLSLPDGSGLPPRWASIIGVPDLDLFPTRYGARSVLFRAGLELRFLHGGLWLLGWLVRWRLLRSLLPLAVPTRAIAERLKGLGTDCGGMAVRVIGRDADGNAVRRTWTLIAEAGDGPEIPPTPAEIVVRKLLSGQVAGGARPCVGLFTLEEATAALHPFAIRTGCRETPVPPLFERALGDAFRRLPAAVRDLHEVHESRVFVGEGRVQRGRGPVAWFFARLGRFPPAADRVPVEVEMAVRGGGERWTRRFGRHRFRSRLGRRSTDAPGVVWERFGLLSFAIRLRPSGQGLAYPLTRARLFGIPLPKFLVPVCDARESDAGDGAAHFDTAIFLRNGRLIVRYTGTLRPVEDRTVGPAPTPPPSAPYPAGVPPAPG